MGLLLWDRRDQSIGENIARINKARNIWIIKTVLFVYLFSLSSNNGKHWQIMNNKYKKHYCIAHARMLFTDIIDWFSVCFVISVYLSSIKTHVLFNTKYKYMKSQKNALKKNNIFLF